MSQEDNYPPGMQHQGDQNGIEPTIDQIFEGISPLIFIRLRGLIAVYYLSISTSSFFITLQIFPLLVEFFFLRLHLIIFMLL